VSAPDAERPVSPIYDRLMKYRRHAGWSLGDLAERSGISKTALSEIANGHHQPRLGTVVAIADALGLDVQLVERPDHHCAEEGPWGWICNRPAGHRMPHIQWLNSVERNAWEPVEEADDAR